MFFFRDFANSLQSDENGPITLCSSSFLFQYSALKISKQRISAVRAIRSQFWNWWIHGYKHTPNTGHWILSGTSCSHCQYLLRVRRKLRPYVQVFSTVKDIHTCLEVTVYDEDPNNKFEFLGKVVIPLMSVGHLYLYGAVERSSLKVFFLIFSCQFLLEFEIIRNCP